MAFCCTRRSKPHPELCPDPGGDGASQPSSTPCSRASRRRRSSTAGCAGRSRRCSPSPRCGGFRWQPACWSTAASGRRSMPSARPSRVS
ncbi:MAG: hypothetical protein MZV64_44350 [Ignavibacteriales bacterium]|nr:hypothetical protein [Ignavibacteriales bacterium]